MHSKFIGTLGWFKDGSKKNYGTAPGLQAQREPW